MLASGLMRWFSRATGPVGCPQVVATARCSAGRRANPAYAGGRRASGGVPTFKVAISQTGDDMIIRVEGEATIESAGALQDGLLAIAACRPAIVTLDLSELRSISCLAMAVLVTFRRGVIRIGGRVRLAQGLQAPVKEALVRAELFDLFETTSMIGEG